ncbi:MAG TPA: O-succinylhomoserine sulfhydrylase [Burkholderiaceae bacterium]|nr:O-succinylhomoserine sulfhydrylase [Burkholderiaceae bacterium]
MKDDEQSPEYRFDTLAIRSGVERTPFGEHTEPIFLTSSFVHDSAAHAAAKFAGEADGFIYSRFGNPTLRTFERRLAALEGADECRATASGMSAIMAVLISLTKTGDHVVCARGVFGTTQQLFGLFARYDIETSYVPLSDPDAWAAAIRPNTRMLFLETPSNPSTEVADLRALSEIARRHGIPLVVDNCFCTPALQRPLALGADIIVHSATKYLDGQGRVLGGAVLGGAKYMNETLQPVLRYCGPTLSAFNAWMLAKGLETLSIRMQRHSENALAVGSWLQAQPAVEQVRYPWLESHPQHALARAQQDAGGAVLAFEMAGADDTERRANAWRVVDGCRLLSITANLGDVKSTITHPASTTHGRMSPQARAEAGIGEGMLRVAVGLEDPADICADLARGIG